MPLLSSSRLLTARNWGTGWNLALGLGCHILMESAQFLSSHVRHSGNIKHLLCCQVWAKCYEYGGRGNHWPLHTKFLLYAANITLITKPDKDSTKKGKPQTSVFHALRCKISQQNSYNNYIKKNYTSQLSGVYFRNLLNYINV